MPGSTPIYGLRYQELSDPPHGPDLGQNLAADVEAELERIDGDVAAPPRGKMAKVGAQSVPDRTPTQITFDTAVESDPASFVDTANDQLVIPESGLYLITAACRLDAAGSADGLTLQVEVNVNGSPAVAIKVPRDGNNAQASLGDFVPLVAGDLLTMAVRHNTGDANATVGDTVPGTSVSAVKVAD